MESVRIECENRLEIRRRKSVIRRVANRFDPVLCREPPEFPVNGKYASLKNEVIRAERRILKELGFYVYVNHPHKVG